MGIDQSELKMALTLRGLSRIGQPQSKILVIRFEFTENGTWSF
jgi:hypothetical protein